MKKYLLLFTSAALLLVGCAKEQIVDLQEGELTNVTFTANLDNGVVTKALVDGDGAAANVNRCIMEIYYGDTFYKRLVQPVTPAAGEAKAYATFANVPVVAGKEYTVLFWADCGGDNNADKYYTTNGPDSLKAVTVNMTEFINALTTGKNDELDAFYLGDKYTITQGGVSKDVTLKRPFAQLNVITTDVAANKAVISEGLLPDKVAVKYKAANIINVATGEVSGNVDYEYVADVYGDKTNWSAVQSHGELTLSMDYVLAAADKGAIDVEFKIKNGGDYVLTHNLTNLPYQRNYRTNVKGDLLTIGGTWTATIEPTWSTPDYDVPYYVASSIDDAQSYIAPTESGTARNKVVDLSNVVPTTDDLEEDGSIKFELTTTSPADMVNFTLPEIPASLENCTGWKITHKPGYPTQNVNVTAPDGTSVIIDAPNSHVTLNGAEYEQVTASTSDNTLVVPAGVTVDKLIVKEGAVEIHGAVCTLTVTPESGKTVCFRECEGLSAAVFEKIYKQGVCNYIDPMYAYELVGEKYNIYKLPVVAMIGDAEYPSIAAAVEAAKANDVIDVVAESVEMPSLAKADITVKGNGTTKVTKFGGLTGKNITLDGFEFTVETNPSGENFVIKNSKFTGKNGLRWAYAYGEVLIENCIFDTKTYGIHFDSNTGGIVTVKDCEIVGFNTFNPHLIFDNCDFVDSENGNMYYVVQSWSDIVLKNCSFSEKWCDANDYQTIGLTTETGLAEISNCTFATGTVYDACKNSELGVIAIDATGNATDGFTAGTFMAKQASDIKMAGLNEVVPVEGKENVYTIVPKQLDETTVAVLGATEYSTFEAAMQAALDAKGGTITLVKDVTLAKSWDHGSNIGDNRDKYSFVLNLNGKTIFRGPNNYHISLCDNDWTVIDETGEGSINKASDGTSNLTYWCNNGHDPFFSKMAKLETCPVFILNGGTYSADGDFSDIWNRKYGVDFQAGGTGDNHMAICKFLLNNATIRNMRILNGQGEIKGGTISGQILFDIDDTKYTQFGIQNSDLYTIISGGVFTLDATTPFIFQNHFTASNLQIKGGTFNFNPSVNYSACIPAGYTSQDNGDGTWTVLEAN